MPKLGIILGLVGLILKLKGQKHLTINLEMNRHKALVVWPINSAQIHTQTSGKEEELLRTSLSPLTVSRNSNQINTIHMCENVKEIRNDKSKEIRKDPNIHHASRIVDTFFSPRKLRISIERLELVMEALIGKCA